jgi:hypothetical protein
MKLIPFIIKIQTSVLFILVSGEMKFGELHFHMIILLISELIEIGK